MEINALTLPKIKQAISLRRERRSLRDIGKRIGVSHTSVWLYLRAGAKKGIISDRDAQGTQFEKKKGRIRQIFLRAYAGA